MSIMYEITLVSNKNIHLDFEGINLTSDAGLLLIKEFYNKFGMKSLAKELDSELYEGIKTRENAVSYDFIYGEFEYQAGSGDYPRRVVCKIEKPFGQMIHMYTFVITNMDSSPEELIRFYFKRGQMKNFIKECKFGFDMD